MTTSAAQALQDAADLCHGYASLGALIGVGGPAPRAVVWAWADRGKVPVEYRPAIERVTGGRIPVERFGDDVAWRRVKDRAWPWNGGRPLQDHTSDARTNKAESVKE